MNLTDINAPIRLNPPLPDGFFHFSPDQVLLPEHLNQLIHFLDVQDRLTRAWLHGSGVLTGLDFRVDGTALVLEPGVALTSDGDLLPVASRLRLTHQRTLTDADGYTGLNPAPKPFTILQPDATNNAVALTAADLADKVVALYLQTHNAAQEVCSIASCDHKGPVHHHDLYVLLLAKGQVTQLPLNLADIPLARVEMLGPRALFGNQVTKLEGANGFQEPLVATITEVRAAALDLLSLDDGQRNLLLTAGFQAAPNWDGRLPGKALNANVEIPGLLAIYEFWGDFCQAYNEWRESLTGLRLAPSIAPTAHPRHVLLGDSGKTNLTRFRHLATKPGASNMAGRDLRRSQLLWDRMISMATNFAPTPLNAASELKIIPSRPNYSPLGTRARPSSLANVSPWNPALAVDGPEPVPLSYGNVGGPNFRRRLPGPEFYRIEGHLGKTVSEAMRSLAVLRAQFNLAFEIVAVQIEEDPSKAMLPPYRFFDIETLFHQHKAALMVRVQDIEDYTQKVQLQVEVQKNRFTAGSTTAGDIRATAAALQNQVSNFSKTMPENYSTFSLRSPQVFLDGYDLSVAASRKLTAAVAPVTEEVDFSPASKFAQSELPVQIGQLYDILRKRRRKIAERVTLADFLSAHPGLEPQGGVVSGGTFVLLYTTAPDGNQRVTADASLPYYWHLNLQTLPVEEEPAQPVKSKVPPVVVLPVPFDPRPPREVRVPVFPPWVDPLPPDFNLVPKPIPWKEDYKWNVKSITEKTLGDTLDTRMQVAQEGFKQEVATRVTDGLKSYYDLVTTLKGNPGNTGGVIKPGSLGQLAADPGVDAKLKNVLLDLENSDAKLQDLRSRRALGDPSPALAESIKAQETLHGALIDKGNKALAEMARGMPVGTSVDSKTESVATALKVASVQLESPEAQKLVKESFVKLQSDLAGNPAAIKSVRAFNPGF